MDYIKYKTNDLFLNRLRNQEPFICKKIHYLSRINSIKIIKSQQPVMIHDSISDPFGLLLRHRIIFMGGEVTDFTADAIVSHLILLDALDPFDEIKLMINSPGGSVTAGKAGAWRFMIL